MNPVLRKDLLGLLRLKRIAAIQVLFVLVLAGLLLLSWPQGGVISISARGQDDLLLGLILGQLVVLVLAVPGVAAVSLVGEREANTLEMLYASRLSAMQIVAGKVLSAVSFPLLLMVAGLPFVGLLDYRGAVDADVLLWAYLILVVSAVLLAVLSLTVSALSKQTSTALVIAYLLTLAACGGVLVPAALMLESQSGAAAQVLHYARAISPVAAVISLLRPQMPGDFAGAVKGNYASYVVFLPAAGAVIVACCLILIAKLRKPPSDADAFGGGGGGAGGEGERTLGRKVMFLIDPKKQRKPLGGGNPVLGKEARTSSLRGGSWMVRIFYGMLVLSLCLAAMSLYGGTEHADLLRYVYEVMVAFQIGAVAAVTPSLTTAAVSGEIENGTFETLRLSRLRGGQIFWGKFLPAFVPALLPLFALLPAYGAVWYVQPAYLTYITEMFPVAVLAMALCCVVGIFCSSFTDNTARATVAAYIAVAALFTLPMLAWWAGEQGLLGSPRTIAWAAMPSPLVMGLTLVPTDANGPVGVGERIAGLRVQHLELIGALCVALLIASRLRLTTLLRRG